MDLEILTPEEVTEKETLLISFLLEHDCMFQKVNEDTYMIKLTKFKKVEDNDSPTA